MYRRKRKEPLRRISEVLKVAATYSPTTQCSTIGDAELNDPVRNGKGWDRPQRYNHLNYSLELKVESLEKSSS